MTAHFLVVYDFDPEFDDWYEIEHPDDCRSRLAKQWYACGVEHYEGEEGIGSYWRHADDPDPYDHNAEPLKPGRYEIEVWHKRHPAGPWGSEEWDGGLRLTEAAS